MRAHSISPLYVCPPVRKASLIARDAHGGTTRQGGAYAGMGSPAHLSCPFLFFWPHGRRSPTRAIGRRLRAPSRGWARETSCTPSSRTSKSSAPSCRLPIVLPSLLFTCASVTSKATSSNRKSIKSCQMAFQSKVATSSTASTRREHSEEVNGLTVLARAGEYTGLCFPISN